MFISENNVTGVNLIVQSIGRQINIEFWKCVVFEMIFLPFMVVLHTSWSVLIA